MWNLNIYVLQKSLNKLCETLNYLYSINDGGCCYVSYLIAIWLDRLHIKYNLVIYSDYERNPLQISNEVSGMNRNTSFYDSVVKESTCSHYCLLILGVGYINRGDYQSDYRYEVRKISHRNIGWIYKNGNWNKMYQTRNNRAVKGIINAFFKNYEK